MLEVVVAAALFLTSVVALSTAYQLFLQSNRTALRKLQAAYLLEEGVEALILLRDGGWAGSIASLATGETHYLGWEGGHFVAMSSPPPFIDGIFERWFVLDSVRRDAGGHIAAEGSFDDGTRKLSVGTAWSERGATTTRFLSTYLTNLFND